MIHIGNPIRINEDSFLIRLEALMRAAYANRSDIRKLVMDIVSTYHPEA